MDEDCGQNVEVFSVFTFGYVHYDLLSKYMRKHTIINALVKPPIMDERITIAAIVILLTLLHYEMGNCDGRRTLLDYLTYKYHNPFRISLLNICRIANSHRCNNIYPFHLLLFKRCVLKKFGMLQRAIFALTFWVMCPSPSVFALAFVICSANFVAI